MTTTKKMSLREIVLALENGDDQEKKEALAALHQLANYSPDSPEGQKAARLLGGSGGADVEGFRAARLPAREHLELKERFGINARPTTIHWNGNDRVFPSDISREECRQVLARHRERQRLTVSRYRRSS